MEIGISLIAFACCALAAIGLSIAAFLGLDRRGKDAAASGRVTADPAISPVKELPIKRRAEWGS